MRYHLPPLSSFSSRKEWEEVCWKKLLQSKSALEMLITAYERHNIVIRAAVIERIRAGERQSNIAREFFLSRQTVNSIKKAVGAQNYKSYRERGKSERKKKVYSRDLIFKKRKPRGRPVRTKYGIVYLPL
ncbi:MAG: hypothetical protein HY436_01800 [Candidatus Liptonbacteria bacterium]|nr:hypothetical protein [Candidatus Liptonbacteria bacterium]